MKLETDILTICILSKSEFKMYEKELLKLFEENYFKNGGMLYSDDFLIDSDYIIVGKKEDEVVAYMAICNLTEKELDRKYETYEEEPILENSILIKHLAVSKEHRKQKIATKLLEHIKSHSIKNNVEYIYLWTTPDNTVAFNFYKKQGFYKMGDFNPDDGVWQGLNRIPFYYDEI